MNHGGHLPAMLRIALQAGGDYYNSRQRGRSPSGCIDKKVLALGITHYEPRLWSGWPIIRIANIQCG